MSLKPKPLAEAMSVISNNTSQLDLEQQFKEQYDRAVEQDKNLAHKTTAEYLNEARVQVNELLSITLDMRNSLSTVGTFAPFFDINYLTQEGATDISKIDQPYMLTIGRQLIKDYRKFEADAQALGNRINDLKVRLDRSVGQSNDEAMDDITEIVTLATLIQSDYVGWGEQFQRIIVSAMTDIVNHLNPLRPANRRIIL